MSSKISSFLEQFNSPNSVRTYKSMIKRFFTTIYETEDCSIEEYAERYFNGSRDYEADLGKYLASMKNNPPLTVRSSLSCVRSFLLNSKVSLPEHFWRNLGRRVRGSQAWTADKPPTVAELRSIIEYATIQGKALILVLTSSGMRIGETLQLKLDDIDLNADPVKIDIKPTYTKSGNRRTAFISNEAKNTLLQWLRVRASYLEAAVKKSVMYSKNPIDQRIFPFEMATADSLWYNPLHKAGLDKRDPTTNRKILHIHSLRKFFITQMERVNNRDIAEALVGHEGYLTRAYRRFTDEELAEAYKKSEHAITVNGGSANISQVTEGLTNRINSLEAKVTALSDVLIATSKTNEALQDEINVLEQTLQTYPKRTKKEIDQLRKTAVKDALDKVKQHD